MKRLISLTAAIALMISILNISAFAEGETAGMTHGEYKAAMAYLIDDYANGKITVQEFSDREVAVTNEYLEYHKGIGDSSYAFAVTVGNHMNGIVQKVNTSVQQWGENARDTIAKWWNDFCDDYNVLSQTTQTFTSNLYGNGVFVKKSRDGVFDEYQCQAYDADYLVIDTSRGLDDVKICYYMNDNSYYTGYLFYDGSYHWNSSFTSGNWQSGYKLAGNTLMSNNGTIYKLYGDVRYIDGTQAPTDDEWEYGIIKKFDETPEKDVSDLLQAFDEELERQIPDLSTTEGLLKSIYARLGQLDSDDDNELLSAINASIISLGKDLHPDNTQLIEVLNELKKGLNNKTDIDPILKKLEEICKSLDYLKTINTLDLIGDTLENLTDEERNYLNTYASLITTLMNKFGYVPIASAITNIESIIFNQTTPEPLTTELYGKKVTLLSSDTFAVAGVRNALEIARGFVSILIVAAWLYGMRKKIAGGA